MDYAQFFPAALTAFLASLVECVEAMTVILAVGTVLGWRGAVSGAFTGMACLAVAGFSGGPYLTLVPGRAIRLAIGALLLAFGFRWLVKAVRRAAGVIPRRDEQAAFARHGNRLREQHTEANMRHRAGMIAAFHIVAIEGLEILFIVLAIGTADRRLLKPASLGAMIAVIVVVIVGAILHRPISRLPTNAIKLAVGVTTSAFGVFWMGKALGLEWPGDDWSILVLAACILAVSKSATWLLARRRAASSDNPKDGRTRHLLAERPSHGLAGEDR